LRKKLIAVAGASAILALFATAAYAAVSVKFDDSFSPNKANTSAGVSVNIESADPAAAQPPIMDRIQISFASGGKWNGPKFPKCTSAIILSKGPKSCPKGSQIGKGNGVGYAKPVVTDPVSAKLTIFNGGSQIFVYVFPDLGPTFVTVGKVIHKKDGPFDYTLDFAIPPIKTLPSAPDASVGTVNTTTPKKTIKKGKKKIALIITPKKCKGTWKAEGDFFFATGEKVVTPVSEKCKK